MRRILLSLSLVSMTVTMPLMAHAEDISLESSITAATVYTSRATVTRAAEAEIPAGEHTVIFSNLPANIMPDSLQVKGTAGADVTFGALAHKRIIEKDLTDVREKELNDKLQKLQDQTSVVQAEKTAINAGKDFLGKIGNHVTNRLNEDIEAMDINPESWVDAADTVVEEMAGAEKALVQHDIQIRLLNEEIQKVRRQLSQLGTGQRSYYEVRVPLEAAAATTLDVTLSYQVPGASWKPVYDARLDTDEEALALTQFGVVRQNTGEDWSDVKLTLSTAQPHRGTSLPPLQPMWVNLYENRRMELSRSRSGAANMMAMESVQADMAAAPARSKAARHQTAEINTGGYVSEYVIPGPSSVPADGTESKVMIGTFDTDTALEIQVKPQLSTNAFLVARAELKGEAPILPGQVNLFRDGAYVGAATFPMLRPGDTEELSFGIDDQVTVERKVLADEHSESGIIAKHQQRTKEFVTKISNLHSSAQDIVVLETVPVSQDEKIKVELDEDLTTSGYKRDYEDTKGLLRWAMEFPAQDSRDIKVGWTVSWPKDMNISGL